MEWIYVPSRSTGSGSLKLHVALENKRRLTLGHFWLPGSDTYDTFDERSWACSIGNLLMITTDKV